MTATPLSKEELRKQIRKCFVDTEMQHDNDLTLFDTDKTIDQLLSLFTAYSKQREVEALPSLPTIDDLYCLACGHPTLFLAEGGLITCALAECPDPSKTWEALRDYTRAAHQPLSPEQRGKL